MLFCTIVIDSVHFWPDVEVFPAVTLPMSRYDVKTAEELRAKAIHARDLARLNAHDSTVAANLQSYAKDLEAQAIKVDAPATDSAET